MMCKQFGCRLIVPTFLAVLAGGCASEPSGSPTTGPSPAQVTPTAPGTTASVREPAHGECLVCKRNADLACVDVDVDKETPRYVYQGRTYYFCSEECRGKFAKDPQKYLEK